MNNINVSPYIVDDVFIEICKYLDFKGLFKLQLLSKHYKNIIRIQKWMHTEVKVSNIDDIYDKIKYLTTNFKFLKYNLCNCTNLTVKLLKNKGVNIIKKELI